MENFERRRINPVTKINSDEDIIELSKKIRDSNALTVSWTNSSQQKNDGINELVSPSGNYTESSSTNNYEVETESYQEDSTYYPNSSAQQNNTASMPCRMYNLNKLNKLLPPQLIQCSQVIRHK